MNTLPTDSAARKRIPLLRGVLRYFPAALAGVAKCSYEGNEKHNKGEELHHARGKSTDHGDCILRHLIDIQDLESQDAPRELILAEADCLAWRALALAQELYERHGAAPFAPGARLPVPAGVLVEVDDKSDATLIATACSTNAGKTPNAKLPEGYRLVTAGECKEGDMVRQIKYDGEWQEARGLTGANIASQRGIWEFARIPPLDAQQP